jgi:hypothetical protein
LEINIFGNVLDASSTDDFPDGPMFQRSTLQLAFVDTIGASLVISPIAFTNGFTFYPDGFPSEPIASGTYGITAVPEPGPLALVGVLGVWLMAMRFRSRVASSRRI